MLLINPVDNKKNYRILRHGAGVFKEAVKGVMKGEEFFHVADNGGFIYDLKYVDNNSLAKTSKEYPGSKLFDGYCLCPPLLTYDETNTDLLSLFVFEGKKAVFFEDVNEYSVVLTGIILEHTDMDIYFTDDIVRLFYPSEERIHVQDQKPDMSPEDLLTVRQEYYPSILYNDYDTMDIMSCFFNVMIYQWIIDRPYQDIKYFELIISQDEGIGSILNQYAGVSRLLSRFGKEVTLACGGTKYSDDILEDYFNIKITPSDSNPDNTVTIANIYALMFTKAVGGVSSSHYKIDDLNPAFIEDLKEYAEAIIRGRKLMGLFLRGTDYFKANFQGAAGAVTMDVGIPLIRKHFDEDKYDGIMLATEDKDILNAVRAEFGDKVIAVSQERYSVNDFTEVNTISELERKRRSPEEYDLYVNDTTINYFYGIYMVSRCDTVVYSNHCFGSNMLKSFGEGSIRKMYCLAEEISEKQEQDG